MLRSISLPMVGTKPVVGNEVVICGKLVNYKGNTPETVANQSYIYSLNGNTEAGGGGSTAESGTLEKPFTPAEANAFIATLAADTNTETDYYIKGKIVKYANNGEFGTQYGNASFYISADGRNWSITRAILLKPLPTRAIFTR